MGKSLSLASYPLEYFEIFEAALERGGLSIPGFNRKEAIALRFDIYGWLRALEHEQHPQAREFRTLGMSIQEGEITSTLTFTPRSASGTISKIRAAIGERKTATNPIPPPPPAADPTPEPEDYLTDALRRHGFAPSEDQDNE